MVRTFEEWVSDLAEGKKGIVPDFINDKLKSKECEKEDKGEKSEKKSEKKEDKGEKKGKKMPPWLNKKEEKKD